MPIKIRGMNFTDYEIQHMLDLIGARKPVRTHEWECIGRLHALKFPDKHRTGHAIKRKFMVLYLTKTPSDDPSCPANVRLAKEIYHKIKARASGIEDDEDDESSEEGNDDIEAPGTFDAGNHAPTTDAAILPTNASIAPVFASIAPANDATPPTNDRVPPTNASIPVIRTRHESFKEPSQQGGLKKQRIDDESSMDKFLRYLMIQNQMDKEERREERKRQQEEERVRREEERIRHEEERAYRQQQSHMMQMMMFSLVSSNPLLAQTQQPLGLSSPTQANASTPGPMYLMNSATNNSNPGRQLDNEIPASERENDNDEDV